PDDHEAVTSPAAGDQPPEAVRGLETIPSHQAMLLKARHARTTQPRQNARSRLVTATAMLIAAVSVGLAGRGPIAREIPHEPPQAHAALPPHLVSYLGVNVPGWPTYQPVATFAKAAGKPPDLAGYVSGMGTVFDVSFARTLLRHGMTPLVQIHPGQGSL